MSVKFLKFHLLLWQAFLISAAGFGVEYIVDNDDGPPAFVCYGTWDLSGTTGYNGGTYLFSRDYDPPSSATWTPDILIPGKYEVSYIFRNGGNRSSAARFTITHAKGTDIVYLNMAGSGVMTELPLGEFPFDAGTSGAIMLDNSGPPVVFIADAVRFVTATDDPPEIVWVARSPEYPKDTDTVTITAEVIDDNEASTVTLHYFSTPGGGSGEVRMSDDGLHGDGAAGDGIFGANIPPQSDGDEVEYHVSALDDQAQETNSSDYSYVVGEEAPREYRSIWADSWDRSFLNASQAEELVNTCRENNLNAIMIEVRKIGDAYYKSNIEPRATNISGGEDYDPLEYLIDFAHDTSEGKKYIEIHAWFVMQRITKGESLDSSHVLVQHPEYVMLNSEGSPGGSVRFIDPGHPGAVDHNLAVVLDCLENYDIDGVNLDYIRYPEASGSWGYNPVSVERFNDFYGKTGQPATSDPDWAEWRRECVTNQVKKIYVKSLMKKPHVVVSADTINWGNTYDNYEASSAYVGVYQDWVGWLDQGIMDYNALM
ncbi:family 10 glycosylhydrolase, partial [Candidatus Sumerlaeota bacterium]|nr:family 10 glycosylhydrolase [Candidatus Sumerlaeota bacterium]